MWSNNGTILGDIFKYFNMVNKRMACQHLGFGILLLLGRFGSSMEDLPGEERTPKIGISSGR